jgi:hypothetical protein
MWMQFNETETESQSKGKEQSQKEKIAQTKDYRHKTED